jgi:hypothetical protein
MTAFVENPGPLIHEFNELIKKSQRRAFITVGTELQKEEIQVLENYRFELAKLKKEFILKKLENEANLVYCFENSALAIQYELEMLVNIKEDNMNAAWGNLVNAEVTIASVIRNHPFNPNMLNGYLDRLAGYQKLLFPDITFCSAGALIKKSLCSICNDDYEKCDHIKGKLYMGEMCCRIITKAELEEASFVEVPANKHCRVISFTDGGKTFDTLTLREIQK